MSARGRRASGRMRERRVILTDWTRECSKGERQREGVGEGRRCWSKAEED